MRSQVKCFLTDFALTWYIAMPTKMIAEPRMAVLERSDHVMLPV